ncbi:DUF262 domain-containing protein [Parabacteroides sp. 52]|uniref:DUF262 domain-containing protein n=1 Tax=unclassified Parabacteroides TaxID=2649774 RepID=UPI0013D3B3E1|nr:MULTISPECIES: DUF262 domain-containing protein [unclassified Parabacteroides]MDH6534181.1 hypothetical protein [Parabacteroides sp. PM5-20]NDV55435.1 DUF262 domain-containing protein [Parabacteroides sp. 52]
MSSNKIELKSISELQGMNFFIPNYQRGYRWTKQQVKDLLDDINEFMNKKHEGFYCIQPLVVKKGIPNDRKFDFKEKLSAINDKDNLLQETEKIISEFTKWEVIDGQQRLTTIFILLSHLTKGNHYLIEYETRPDSEAFLAQINANAEDPNIDYYHMIEAKKQIAEWFEIKAEDSANFLNTLLEKVKFIWYESKNENPIKVFTRLNIGKISLTNAELIKALFLNRSNFRGNDSQKIRLQQQEIAGEWDTIEYTLQNDEFWLFLNEKDYDKPTRIDLIFDLICSKNILKLTTEEIKEIGTDEYQTFRYFYTWFKKPENENGITECWQEVKKIFQIFVEWFNDLELYHYIGYLLSDVNGQRISKLKISDLISHWSIDNQTKDKFVNHYLIEKIKDTLSACSDLNKQYETSNNPKTQCRPILLLHNIQTIVNQNKNLKKSEKYRLPVFYKFPFHLFKKEKWDVEHIDSNTENQLESERDQKEWLKYSLFGIQDEILKGKIHTFIQEGGDFFDLYNDVTYFHRQPKNESRLSDDEKDRLYNFCLLDSSTNRGYGNSIFPSKRRIIVGKDQGKKYEISDTLEVEEKEGGIAFVPPCTKNVFLKYFNHSTNNLREWDKQDAEAYLSNIRTALSIFLESTKERESNEQ